MDYCNYSINKIVKQPSLVVAIPVILAIVLSIIPSLFSGYPKPIVYDEWGYLLSADTFDQGRWSNPTPEHWQHFETMHQLQVPSYQAKYPPAQGMIMALGMKLGHPIFGIWLSIAVMIGAITWMLQSWFPARWALMGGCIAALQLVVVGQPFGDGSLGYWSQSYWGGAMAAAGGALLLGAGRRIMQQPSVGLASLFCVGAAILALSRPKEGLLIFLLIAAVLVVWLLRLRGTKLKTAVQLFVFPALAFGLLLLGFIGAYNHAVTGKVTEMPWLTHYQQYVAFPISIWDKPKENIQWRNRELRLYYSGWELDLYKRHTTLNGFIDTSLRKIARTGIFYVGPIFMLSLLMLPWMLKKLWLVFAAAGVGIILINNLVTFAAFPHYSAPMTACFIILLTAGMRYLSIVKWHGFKLGRYAVSLILLAAGIQAAFAIPTIIQQHQKITNIERHSFAQQLQELPGKDLVLLRYGEHYNPHGEWVFNMANIDEQEVVWARELSSEQNQLLLEHFADRRVWLAEVGFGKPPVLRPYTAKQDVLQGANIMSNSSQFR